MGEVVCLKMEQDSREQFLPKVSGVRDKGNGCKQGARAIRIIES